LILLVELTRIERADLLNAICGMGISAGIAS
jgi:hypothetical protein